MKKIFFLFIISIFFIIFAVLNKQTNLIMTIDNVIAAAEDGDCDKETFDIVVNNIGKIMEETI